jgi:hypothetical protein
MVKHICEKCGKEFKQKCHYLSHINRKKPCDNETKIVLTETAIKELIDKAVEEKLKNISSNNS